MSTNAVATTYYVPVRDYIAGLWPANLADPPSLDLLDGVWMEPLNFQTEPSIRVRAALLFETELALSIPGLDSVSIVLAGTPDSRDTAFMFEFDATPKPILKIVDIPVALRFSADLLKPARRVADPSGGAGTIEVNPDVDHVDITLATMTLAIDFDGNITLDTQLGFNLPLCLIGDTGVAIEAEGIRFFLGHDAPPAGKPVGWRGVHIPDAKLYLPGELAGIVGNLDLKDGYIGNGGFSGSVTDSWTPALSATLFGMDFTLQSASIGFVQNTPTQCEIKGTVTVPFFDGPVGVDIGINHDGSLGVTLASATGLVTLSKPGIMDLEIDSLGFAVEHDTFIAKLSGEITPDIGGLDWPTFKVKELSIDSHGNVRLEGGWLDLPDQYVLDFHGFKLEITKIGFGKTEDGGKWIGFSGGLKLVDGLQAGASVEGLRVTWFDDGRPTRVTLNGVGVEFAIPDVLRFKGAVAYRELPGDVHRFDGAITLQLIALDLEIDGVLVVGSAPGYTFFAIYLDAELPAGIPLWATGVSLYGMAGLFALQMEPDKHSDEKWYGVGPTDGWYHRGTVGVTDLNKKWVNKQGSLALGAGVTLGTAYDNGYTFNGKVLFVIVFPGPILLLEGKANLLKERAALTEEAIFRAIAVLDGRAGTFTFGLDAIYKYDDNGKLIDIRGGVEAFFSFTDASLWHVWLGQKDPKEKRIRAEIFSLFEANAYFMADARQLAMGAWVGYSNHWSFGPLSVSVEAWIDGNAVVSFKPVHFHGDLWLHGAAQLSAFGFGLKVKVDARVAADVFDPFHVLADFNVAIDLPWPLPSFSVDISLEWGPEPTLPPLPVPLKEIAVEHFKVTTKWPLPRGSLRLPDYDRGDGFLRDPAPVADETAPPPAVVPAVPIDARPHVTFSRSVNDDAKVGVNGQPVSPEWEQIGDPAKNEGPLRARYAVKAVALHRWNSQSSSWELTAAAPKQTGVTELYGSWAPIPPAAGAGAGAAQVKLWLWSKTAFDYTRHTGGAWDEWFTDQDPGYPCVPPAPGTMVCCDLSDMPTGGDGLPVWLCREHPELRLLWYPQDYLPVTIIDPPVRGYSHALCFVARGYAAAPMSTYANRTEGSYELIVLLTKPATTVRVTLVDEQGAIAVGIDAKGKFYGPFEGGTPANPVIEIVGKGLVRVLIRPNSSACVFAMCADIGPPDPADVQRRTEMEQHLLDELALWSQTGQVFRPHSTYRVTVRTTLETVPALGGIRTQTELAYFRTQAGPGLANLDIPSGTPDSNLDDLTLRDPNGNWITVDGAPSATRVLKNDLNTLGPYVTQTVPPTVPAPGEKPLLPRPVFRAYDVGVQFNEDYVDLMYRLERRDLGLYLYDNNNRPVRDAQGRLIILGNEWGTTDKLRLDASDTRWITKINENGCGSIDISKIPRDQSLDIGSPAQVLSADTLYEARLVPLLLHDDFAAYAAGTTASGPSGTLDGWTVIDQGAGGPSQWTIASRGTPPSNIIKQSVPVWGGTFDARDPVKPGTMLVRGDPAWTDYRLSVYLRSTDDRAVGVVFRYADSANYYRFSMDRSARVRRLVRVINGIHTVLAEDEFVYRPNFDYLIAVEVIGTSLRVYQDGDIVLQATDSSLSHGQIGLYCWHNRGSEFADVRLDDFRPQASVAYRFKFTTSRFANFVHLLHSYQDETWLNPALTATLAAELAGAVDAAQPITAAEARAYDDLATGLLGQAAHEDGAEVQVTRVEQSGLPMAFLVRGPEPIDWTRTRLTMAHSGMPAVRPDAPGTLKLTQSSTSPFIPIQESIGLVLRDAMDLSGTHIDYLSLPGPLAEPTADPVLFEDRFDGSPSGRLFAEDFGPNALDRYTILDESTNLAPSSWAVAGGEIVQTSSIYGGSTSAAAIDKPGTSALVGSVDWTNVQITTTLRSTTGSTIGLLFRYQDATSYYRFSMDANLGYRRLVKRVPGQNAAVVVWQDAVPYTLGQPMTIVLYAYESWLVAYLDDHLLFAVQDTGPKAGRVGWYCWNEPGAHFSALTVEALTALPVLWRPSFTNLSEVQVLDEPAALAGPSHWAVSSGTLTQTSNIHAAPGGVVPSGTYAVGATPPLGDVRISVKLRSDATGDIGVMFRYQDADNYYRFSMDHAGSARRLIKKVAGVATILWQDAIAYVTGTSYEVTIDVRGADLKGWVDGLLVFAVTDSDLRQGQIALYCASNPGARFQRVLALDTVRRLGRWTVDDWGLSGGPSVWMAAGGRLAQTSSIGGGPQPDAAGTQVLAGELSWTDARYTVRLQSDDDGAIGLLFRYVDEENYYRVSLDQQSNSRRLVKKTNGVYTTLWQQANGYVVGASMTVAVDVVGSRLIGYLDEAPLFDVIDSDHAAGKIGLYCASNNGAQFSYVALARPGPEALALFRDRFKVGGLSTWTTVDEGTTGGPSTWQTLGIAVRQRSSIGTPPIDRNTLSKQGTMLVAGDPAWTDVIVQTRLLSRDGSSVGVVFRYLDQTHYYRFSMDRLRGYRRLVKNVGGTFTTLWEDDVSYAVDRPYELTMVLIGQQLRGFLDGVPLFAVTDADIGAGRFGLYCWTEPKVYFWDVSVYPATQAFRNWLLSDRFTVLVRGRWQFVDDGTVQAPSAWEVTAGELRQTSAIASTDTAAAVPDKPGSYALAGDGAWTDYRASVRIQSDSDGGIGLMFRYRDKDNYYRLSLDRARSFRRLIKKVGGAVTTLWSDGTQYNSGQPYMLTIDCMGRRIRCYLNGELLVAVEDGDISSGKIGLYSWGNTGARFGELTVGPIGWALYHRFDRETTLPAGTQVRVYGGNQSDAPPGKPWLVQRFVAGAGQRGRLRIPMLGTDVRVVDAAGRPGHRRTIIPQQSYAPIAVKVIRKADGTGFLVAPAAAPGVQPFSRAQYSLSMNFARDNRAVDPHSLVLREAGLSDSEIVQIDVPWETR